MILQHMDYVLSSQRLKKLLKPLSHKFQTPVFLCIGTDRIIGDCLGPFTGTLLKKNLPASKTIFVYGTLQHTIHALNLSETYSQIKKKHPDNPVIAIDACLGSYEKPGSLLTHSGPLSPGSGVDKVLPFVGDISITGIVGKESSQPYLDLQTVRLALIADMAEKICDCIIESL